MLPPMRRTTKNKRPKTEPPSSPGGGGLWLCSRRQMVQPTCTAGSNARPCFAQRVSSPIACTLQQIEESVQRSDLVAVEAASFRVAVVRERFTFPWVSKACAREHRIDVL